MCGILGLIHKNDYTISVDHFRKINKYNIHRGPDDQSEIDLKISKYNLKLGHTRLSIQDLSEKASQPMKSFTERYLISFNGEIYNHLELRKLLLLKKFNNWRTNSDTETLVNLFEFYDFSEVLQIIEGMFSFMLLDFKKNFIYFSRDLAGEKPLYLHFNNSFIASASDLNTIKNLPMFEKEINNSALKSFLEYNYIPAPDTIFKNTFKLPAASYLKINLEKFSLKKINNFDLLKNDNFVNFNYWWKIKKNTFNYSKCNQNEIEEIAHTKIKNSIKKQLISDVPLGAFLSAGIDSSLVVSIMQELQSNTKTFTIGYENKVYDESIQSQKIAEYLSTDHVSYKFSNNEIINFIKNSKNVFSEPFADSSQLPTLLVSKLAKEKVKVVLTGDGGDELFGGYNRYIYANKFWKTYKLFLPIIKNPVIKLLIKNSPNFLYNIINNLMKLNLSKNSIEKIIYKSNNIIDELSYYNSLTKEWNQDDNIVNINEYSSIDHRIKKIFDNDSFNFEEKMMVSDFLNYLPDDILCKVDRSTMYYSLESRAPLLSKDVVDFAFSLPINNKLKNGESKVILKKILSKYLPENLINKNKMGFGVPIGDLMKNELKGWTQELLSKNFCNKHNFFNIDTVDKVLKNHINNKENNQYKLWSLIQFNLWYDNNF